MAKTKQPSSSAASSSSTLSTAQKKNDSAVGKTNDQDHSNNGKSTKPNNSINNTDSSNGVAKSNKKHHEKTKEHKCRCASSSSSSVKSSSTVRTTVSTATSTNLSYLRNLKDLPVREYEKLSPKPSVSLNKNSSSVADGIMLNETKKNCSPNAAKHNGNSTSELKIKQKTDDINKHTKPTDDALILRICSLESGARRLSSLSINRDNGEKLKAKIKVRTKTDPHPVSALHKQRDLNASGTLTTVFTHSSSKCNCSSCKSMSSSVSNSDNHNKTKSVGTQHDANNAYDPWIRQTESINHKSSKSYSSKSITTTTSSILNQKLANTNAKVIVITDDFKKKALTNQEVFVDTKRKMLRYMKANKLTNSSRSMDDDNESDEPVKIEKQKAISKSVDNVSQLSTELDQLDNVGSVELIFISDEFLNNVDKPDVIILVS